jgi:polyhydroxyalkanoate synthesis regulator phasin
MEMTAMIDLLKKTLFAGVGLAVLTKEKLVDLGKEVAKQANLTEAQAREFQEDLQKKAEEARDHLQSEIDRRVEAALKKMGVARTDQVNALLARVEELEKRLEKTYS